jgi:hypothetical protein
VSARPADYDPKKDATIVAPHPPKVDEFGRRWDRGGVNAYSGGMHKTETVDYALLLDGERTLVLDDCEVTWKPGDIVIDVGAWHQWSSRNLDGGARRVRHDRREIRGRAGGSRAGQRQGHGRRRRSASCRTA